MSDPLDLEAFLSPIGNLKPIARLYRRVKALSAFAEATACAWRSFGVQSSFYWGAWPSDVRVLGAHRSSKLK
jgi:hypothetical protein